MQSSEILDVHPLAGFSAPEKLRSSATKQFHAVLETIAEYMDWFGKLKEIVNARV